MLSQKSYLNEGRKSTWAMVKEIVTFTTSICLLLIAIWTFITNVYTTNENEKGIKKLQIKVDSLLIFHKSLLENSLNVKQILPDTIKVKIGR